MLMGSTVPAPAAISEALSLINVMLDPQQAKQNLEQLRAEIAKLEQARVTAVEEQKKAAADRAAADARIAQAEAAVAAIQQREEAVTARELQADRIRALTRERLAAAEA
jgi:septal ring factor EnvC (AmiA/AmiB activator)